TRLMKKVTAITGPVGATVRDRTRSVKLRVLAIGRASRDKSAKGQANTITVLAGDLFNPSAQGLARVEGERLYGRQIVDVMNAVGLDYATFGNHEFDLSRADFLKR